MENRHPITAQLFIIHTRHFDMNVNPIKQRTRDSFLISGHHRRSTSARFSWTAI